MDEFDKVHISLPDVWERNASVYADKQAVVCGSDSLTWRELGDALNRAANVLNQRGIGPGDRVVILGDNSIDTLVAIFGVIRSGACAVPLSTMLSAEQLAMMMADSGSRMAIVSGALLSLAEAVRSQACGIPNDHWAILGAAEPGWPSFNTMVSDASATPPAHRPDPHDPFIIIYSSGTTGLPKGIVHSHYSRHQLTHILALEMRFDHRSRALTTTSVYSMGTFLMMLPALYVGGTIVIMSKFSSGEVLKAIARHGITHSFMVPSQFMMILAEQAPETHDLSSVRCLLSAGSPMRAELKQDIRSRISSELFELYGNSEGFGTMLKPEQQEAKPNTVGTPMIGYEARIIDGEGRELPCGELGEIVGYGGSIMTRYHNRPAETAQAIWRDESGRSFVRTGDIGRLDADGFVSIVDRKKDMIISGGFNVFPVDIEKVLAGHPDVFDVAVIAIPHPRWDETPLAIVVLKPRASVTCEEMAAWANAKLARHQRVAAVEFRADLPRNVLGKVLKRELREPYWTAMSPVSPLDA